MNREVVQPLSLGAITTWCVMAFSFYIPLSFLLVIIFCLLTAFIYYRKLLLKYLLVISLSLLIGSFGCYRVNYNERRMYLPLKNSLVDCDIKITGDSRAFEGGYIGNGVIVNVNNDQTISKANYNVAVISKKEFYKGFIFRKVKIEAQSGKIKCYLKDEYNFEVPKIYQIRKKILSNVYGNIKSPLLQALITGNKKDLDPHDIKAFRESGCSHILALSGFHVSVIVLLVFLVLRIFFTGFKVLFLSLIILFLYSFIVGASPSLIRSVTMFSVGLFFKLRKKRKSVYIILVISFFINTFLFPEDYYSISFKLSYLALAGIVVIGKDICLLPLFRLFPGYLKFSLASSLGAICSTSLLCFSEFGIIYPVGILSSLVLTPLVTIYIWIGIISMVISPLSFLIEKGDNIILFIAEFFSNYPIIDESVVNPLFITLISVIFPVILFIIKLHRRFNAGRFNAEFKL